MKGEVKVGRAQGRPVVAVVGRPNVGKSSLVNRIVGRRAAIVEGTAGVTRDRNSLEVSWAGHEFEVVDTGGWLSGGSALERQVSGQAALAIEASDLVLFVLDVTVGVTAEDEAVADLLRRSGRPVMVVANKVDSSAQEPAAWEMVSLGLGDPWMISSIHGRGAGDLLDALVARLPAVAPCAAAEEPLAEPPASTAESSDPTVPRVALVGRPNVGKSSLFNRLVGEERSVVHDVAGTTTDAVDTVVETPEGSVRFVDTAGLRRKSRIGEGTEYFAMVRSLRAIDSSDVALLVVDATEGVTNQDQRLAERVDAAGSPIVVVANKWDLLGRYEREDFREQVEEQLGFLSYAPLITTSALSGLGVSKLLPALSRSLSAASRRVPTRELNRVVEAAQRAHPAPSSKVLYATQGAVSPPTFTLFATRELPPDWLRYLERTIREHFALGPTPVQMRVRRRDEPQRRRRARR